MILPADAKGLINLAKETTEICHADLGQRSSVYRQYAQWVETGRAAGGLALANILYSHKDRLQSYLFSPSDLRFSMDYENHYSKYELDKGEVVARVLTREWERNNIDECFAQGVGEALTYGACFHKTLGSIVPPADQNSPPTIRVASRLVMPWQFGVYEPNICELDDQEAMVETAMLNKHAVWRRIAHLPDAEKKYRRILSHSQKGTSYAGSFMHQVLSTAVLNPSLQNNTIPQPGGIVQLANDPNFTLISPMSGADTIPIHEQYLKNDDTGDWVTVQYIEPDILIAPLWKRSNLFCAGAQPYTLIQPNKVADYIWGRSEIVDLMQLQSSLSEALDDAQRLTGLQVDKILAFINFDGITDETYGQMRSSGYFSGGAGASVQDVTPKYPAELTQHIKMIIELFDRISGFGNILSGQGEAGVRAGNHAETLLKTSSPRLRDRALAVERQASRAADKCLDYLEAKDARAYYTEIGPDGEVAKQTEFLLSQLPDDRRVIVDSHSSSPIYEDNHQNLVAFGLKSGIVDGESAIEMLPFPRKDILKDRFKKAEAAKAKLIQEHPELLTKGAGRHK